MKIGIVSDTHDNLPAVEKAVRLFNRQKVGMVIHLGDWCSPFVPHFFAKLRCPLRGIFGNNDADMFRMLRREKKYVADVEFSKRIFVTTAGGRRIVAYHGDDEEVTRALIASTEYDVVLTGHTHVSKIEHYGRVLHVNPGTLSTFRQDRINKDFTVAVYETAKNEARLWKV